MLLQFFLCNCSEILLGIKSEYGCKNLFMQHSELISWVCMSTIHHSSNADLLDSFFNSFCFLPAKIIIIIMLLLLLLHEYMNGWNVSTFEMPYNCVSNFGQIFYLWDLKLNPSIYVSIMFTEKRLIFFHLVLFCMNTDKFRHVKRYQYGP